MSPADIVLRQFHIEIEGQTLTLRKLNASGEMALHRLLCARLKKSWGPAGFAANCKDMWAFMRANGMGLELDTSVRAVTQMQASNADPEWDALQTFRATPEGVAVEVWFRRDPAEHPTLTEDALQAVITDVNAWEVAEQVARGLSDDGKSRPAVAGG